MTATKSHRVLLQCLSLSWLVASLPAIAQQGADVDPAVVEQLEVLVETLGEVFGERPDLKHLARRVDVVGMANSAIESNVERDLLLALQGNDFAKLLQLINFHDLQLDLEASSDVVLVMRTDPKDSFEEQLMHAVRNRDLDTARELLRQTSLDVDARVQEDHFAFTPLMVASYNAHREMIELLLEAGADPNRTDESGRQSAVGYALLGRHIEISRLLLDAGADLPDKVGLLDQSSPLNLALAADDKPFANFLLARGVNVDQVNSYGWTPLMEALFAADVPLSKLLIPYSDVRIRSTRKLERVRLGRDTGYRVIPEANALFLSSLLPEPDSDALSDMIMERLDQLGGEDDRREVVLVAGMSAARLAYEEGDAARAARLLEAAIVATELRAIDGLSSASLVKYSLNALVALHELDLARGGTFDTARRVEAEWLDSIGGDSLRWHDMLSLLARSKERYPRAGLTEWQQQYGPPKTQGYNFAWIYDWINGVENVERRNQLYDTLDFFELDGRIR